jgi:hypothetical protein
LNLSQPYWDRVQRRFGQFSSPFPSTRTFPTKCHGLILTM